MCVSLLERVKQGKSNIILILILSARSQDRDQQGSAKRLLLNYFNPLGRKTETCLAQGLPHEFYISIHSVARPRPRKRWKIVKPLIISIHSVARPRHTLSVADVWTREISIHSVARPRPAREIRKFNPLNISIHSVARPRPGDRSAEPYWVDISIHSVARPRLKNN